MRSVQGVIKEWEKGLGAALKTVIGKNSSMYTVRHCIQTCQHISYMYPGTGLQKKTENTMDTT